MTRVRGAQQVTRADLIWASAVSLCVLTVSYGAFGTPYARGSRTPSVDRGYGVPVNIVPLLDEPQPLKVAGLPKLGIPGGRRVPPGWERQRATPAPVRAAPGRLPAAEARGGPDQRLVTSPGGDPADAGPVVLPDAGVLAPADAGLRGGAGGAGDSDGAIGEEGLPEGVPEGTITEAWQVRAIDMYKARLINFVRSYFHVKGSGLPPARLRTLKVQATLRIDAARRVEGSSMTPSGEPAFDYAAQAALDALRGLELPPPPSDYPGAVQRTIRVVFVCRERQCD